MKLLFILTVTFSTMMFNSVGSATMAQRMPKRQARNLHNADFQQDWQRYPSPDAILQEFKVQFPYIGLMGRVDTTCSGLTEDNRPLLGDSNPITGFASVPHPNSSFVAWYSGCLKQYSNSDYEGRFGNYRYFKVGDDIKNVQKTAAEVKPAVIQFLGQEYTEQCKAANPEQWTTTGSEFTAYMSTYENCAWTMLSPTVRLEIVNYSLHQLLGPEEVLVDLQLQTKDGELAQKLLDFVNKSAADPSFKFDDLRTFERLSTRLNNVGGSSTKILPTVLLLRYLILQTAYLQY